MRCGDPTIRRALTWVAPLVPTGVPRGLADPAASCSCKSSWHTSSVNIRMEVVEERPVDWLVEPKVHVDDIE